MSLVDDLLSKMATIASLRQVSEELIQEVPDEHVSKALDMFKASGFGVGEGAMAMLSALALALMQEPESEEQVKDTALLYSHVFMTLISNVGFNALKERKVQ